MKKHPDLVDRVENPSINCWLGPDGHAICYLLNGGMYNIVLLCSDNLPELVNTARAGLQEMREFLRDGTPD